MLFNSRRTKIADEDYKEAQGLDPHPETFDRAAYRRLRDSGLSHEQITGAVKDKSIPIEDLDAALNDNQGDLESAIKDATSYANSYGNQVSVNANVLSGDTNKFVNSSVFNGHPNDFKLNVIKLFLHHLSARDRQKDDDHPLTDRYNANPRNHEWMMHLCTMLEPSLKNDMRLPNAHGNRWRLDPGSYQDTINSLQGHIDNEFLSHSAPLVNDPESKINLSNFIATKRKQNALDTLASGQFGSPEYREELYDPE
jgi:hypothetical protein